MRMWGRNGARSFLTSYDASTNAARWQSFWKLSRWARISLLSAFLPLWITAIWLIHADTGLFYFLGTDFAMYFSQSTVLRSNPGSIYSVDALNTVLQPLLEVYSYNHPYADAAPVPYPPLFGWLFTPFTIPPPPTGLVLWEGFNLLAAVYLAWRASHLFPAGERVSAALMVLVSFPIVYCLIVGQPQILLACAVGECYLSLRTGRDFVAGLWLGFLLFKPQYGFLIGLLLIWKGRWKAAAGAAIGGFVVVGGSLTLAGIAAVQSYPDAFDQYVGFRADVWEHMINWRSFVLAWSPEITDRRGMFYTHVLNMITVLITAWAWRGPWAPRDPRFSTKMALLLVTTLLTSHHSLNYGPAILALPLASVMAEASVHSWVRMVIIGAVLLPTLSFTAIKVMDPTTASRLLTYSLVFAYGALLIDVWRCHRLRAA